MSDFSLKHKFCSSPWSFAMWSSAVRYGSRIRAGRWEHWEPHSSEQLLYKDVVGAALSPALSLSNSSWISSAALCQENSRIPLSLRNAFFVLKGLAVYIHKANQLARQISSTHFPVFYIKETSESSVDFMPANGKYGWSWEASKLQILL